MNKQKQDEEQQKKTVTRYEKRLERRKVQAAKEARSERLFRLSFMAVILLIVAVIGTLTVTSAINRNKAINDAYIKVGDHDITRVEFDYYYSMAVSNYINMYGSYLSYMGLDVNQDYDQQEYSEGMSWKDAFEQMGVNQMIQTKAIVDDAKANGFSADLTVAYQEFEDSLKATAASYNYSEAQYYRASFGSFATKANLEPFVKENLLVEAYYDHLMEQFTPSEEDIEDYYEENKENYDKVSYRSFTLTADIEEGATTDQIRMALDTLKTSAEKMLLRRESGEDFKALCLEFSSEDTKAMYQDPEKDPSLAENASYSSVSSYYREWLFDEDRVAGDLNVVEEESANSYHVVEFIERIYDENVNETISNTLATEEVSEYISALTKQYEVTDIAGKLNYLAVEESLAAEQEMIELEGFEEEGIEEESVEAESDPS